MGKAGAIASTGSVVLVAALGFMYAGWPDRIRLHPHVVIGLAAVGVLMMLAPAIQRIRPIFKDSLSFASQPKLAFSADLQGFYLTHLGGEAARFIEIDPITNSTGSSVRFDRVDFLEVGNKRPLSYRLVIFTSGKTAKMEKVIFMMFRRWGNRGDVELPVTIRFRWNKALLEEKIVLKWVANESRFETEPSVQ
jgi:hypothetical protein